MEQLLFSLGIRTVLNAERQKRHICATCRKYRVCTRATQNRYLCKDCYHPVFDCIGEEGTI